MVWYAYGYFVKEQKFKVVDGSKISEVTEDPWKIVDVERDQIQFGSPDVKYALREEDGSLPRIFIYYVAGKEQQFSNLWFNVFKFGWFWSQKVT